MISLLTEDDFVELPEEAAHKWIHLEKIAHSRLLSSLENLDATGSAQLKIHYMNLVVKLAAKYGVSGVTIPNENSPQTKYDALRLLVIVAQAEIWADSTSTFPFGRVEIARTAKSTILELANKIEIQIDSLDLSEKRRIALHKWLEDFRREINQPKTRIGVALSSLAQISTIIAATTTTLATGPDAYTTIMRLLGAEQLGYSIPELALIEQEAKLLLTAPPKQIEDQSTKIEPQ